MCNNFAGLFLIVSRFINNIVFKLQEYYITTSQLRSTPRKIAIKYIGPLAVYKIVDTHNYLLVTLD